MTLLSTDYVSIEFLIQEKWGGSTQLVTLGQSLFIVGTAVGPAFLGPASDLLGRRWLYVGAIVAYALGAFQLSDLGAELLLSALFEQSTS